MDADPYVAPPAEPVRTPRLLGLRLWLVLAVVLLLVVASALVRLVGAREDPTLQFPGGAPTPPGAAPAEIPELPSPAAPQPGTTSAPPATPAPLMTPTPVPAPT